MAYAPAPLDPLRAPRATNPTRAASDASDVRAVPCQVSIPSTNYFWQIIYYVCQQLPNTKWLAITMGILTIAIIILVRK